PLTLRRRLEGREATPLPGRSQGGREGVTLRGPQIGRTVVSNGVAEEPISSELVLVDEALARRARAALPDPPWLLPALAELRERPEAERAEAPAPVAEPPAPSPDPSRPPRGGAGG